MRGKSSRFCDAFAWFKFRDYSESKVNPNTKLPITCALVQD